MAFTAGDFVGIQCDVQSGPFSDEKLITVETIDGAISGFVSASEIRKSGNRWEVRGKVKEVTPGYLTVWIFGSFFTTNGIANVSPHLAMAA